MFLRVWNIKNSLLGHVVILHAPQTKDTLHIIIAYSSTIVYLNPNRVMQLISATYYFARDLEEI